MSDPRHEALAEVVKRLPSDFEPLGERSRSFHARFFLEMAVRYADIE